MKKLLIFTLCASFTAEGYEKTPIVGTVDTGLYRDHEIFENKIYTNPKEFCGNNIDDDKNGYIDDCWGWNFAKKDHITYDYNGHGTHIAGIIAKSNVKLVPCVYWTKDLDEELSTKYFVGCERYLINLNVDIINISGGGERFNREEYDLMKTASEKGILIIAAAGNSGENLRIPFNNYYPCETEYWNVICVANVDAENNLVKSSNFSKKHVHLAVLGENVKSSIPPYGLYVRDSSNSFYGFMTGTSQSAAGVSKIVSDIWNELYYQYGHLSKVEYAKKVKQELKNRVIKKEHLKDKLIWGGVLKY